MVRTLVGYSGGTTPAPTYRRLGDHGETLLVEYDQARVSYEQLLAVFWESHDPTRPAWSRQYRSALFVRDDGQRRVAEASKEAAQRRLGAPLFTDIIPAGPFHPAEDYHQKYYLRQTPDLLRELTAIYPDPAAFACSTAAARINGWLGGNGTAESARADLDHLGLSPAGKERLRSLLRVATP